MSAARLTSALLRQSLTIAVALLSALLVLNSHLRAADWPQFRGPDADGVCTNGSPPLVFGESTRLAWKLELPGPGSSSPIVIGDRVFVTCWSGYGADDAPAGAGTQDVVRHLVCVDRSSGKKLWDARVTASVSEDAYTGFLREHGYASSTPVSDGQSVYAFFGKSGVVAFNMEGQRLWQTSVGTQSSSRRWGSAASLVLHEDSVIVNASEESLSIRALDKATGAEKWKTEADLLELAFGTPRLVPTHEGRLDLVLAVPEEVWGLNPDTGKLRWYCVTDLTGNISPTINARDGVLYAFGGFRGAGGVAFRPGDSSEVTSDRIVWKTRTSSYVATPVLHDGYLYWVDDNGQAHCVDATSGESKYRQRLVSGTGGRPVYASPILCGDRLYCVSRRNGVYVLAARPEFAVLAHNELPGDNSDFNASPAISGDRLLLRSDRCLYCFRDAE